AGLLSLFVVAAALGVAAVEPKEGTAAPEPPGKTIFSDAEVKDSIVVKLAVESGRENDHGRDNRVFTIPVACADARANFTWGCGGQTIITKSFADKARIEIRDNEALKQYLDGNGAPLFVGDAPVDVVFAGQSHQVVALVMRDGQVNKN